jgi:hypothetical protein
MQRFAAQCDALRRFAAQCSALQRREGVIQNEPNCQSGSKKEVCCVALGPL